MVPAPAYSRIDYLISTNFNLAQGKKQCWRYETADKMLSMPHTSTIDYYKSVLRVRDYKTNMNMSNIYTCWSILCIINN